jgi:glutamate formiminotransferase
MALVECIANFSEGRRADVIAALVTTVTDVPGVTLLDQHTDADHNRTVLTFAGPPDAVRDVAFDVIARAAELIDMTAHRGQHPRIGATDVVPFVPLAGATMADCVRLARELGARVGAELDIPVYLYGEAAQRPERANLADVRRGEYEALCDAIATDPDRAPDFGPACIGSAGATAIGARGALIAYNVYLTTDDVTVAQRIAEAVRASGGGLVGVKALGLLVKGQAQVSMNLIDFAQTPPHRAIELIRREAARYGVGVRSSELVGLIPEDALIEAARWYLQLDDFTPDQILERRLHAAFTAE